MSAPHSYSQEHYLLCDNREKKRVTKIVSERKGEKGERKQERDVQMFETIMSKNKGRTSQVCACYEVVLQPKSGLLESPSQTET